jgi:broad specificity phosphatase PhoE
MATVFFITHPDVSIDPNVPVTEWQLNARGRARMHAMLNLNWVAGIVHIASSTERKAVDGATILGAHLGLRPVTHPGLGENDRSSTGYLAKPEFEAMADAFFAHPEQSVAGWERAVDAQERVVAAVRDVLRGAPVGDVAVVAHGGVGALLLCHLLGSPISRAADQPAGSGGHVFAFDRTTWILCHSWRSIDHETEQPPIRGTVGT